MLTCPPSTSMDRCASKGPIVVTAVAPAGEAARLSVKMGDVIVGVDDVTVEEDRAAVVARVRKGGEASILLATPPPLFGGGGDGSASAAAAAASPPLSASGAPSCPSLLVAAQDRGFSADGEIFDAEHLAVIAREVCGVDATCETFAELSPAAAAEHVRAERLLIVPYDSHPGSKLPTSLQGNSAHYGVAIGACFRVGSGTADANVAAAAAGAAGETAPTTLDADVAEEQQGSGGQSAPPPPPPPPAALAGPKRWTKEQQAPAALRSEDLLLLVQHSNSARLAIATHADFLKSNLQMSSFDASRFAVRSLNLANQIVVAKGLVE